LRLGRVNRVVVPGPLFDLRLSRQVAQELAPHGGAAGRKLLADGQIRVLVGLGKAVVRQVVVPVGVQAGHDLPAAEPSHSCTPPFSLRDVP